MKKHTLLLLLLACCAHSGYTQLKDKFSYVGVYQRGSKPDEVNDTLFGDAFFSRDSFAIIYMVKHDSDYQFPLFKGTWQLVNDSVAELHYTDKQRKTGKFETGERTTEFFLDNVTFMR